MGRRRFHRDNVQYDDTCSRDCSQTKPRILGDTTVFNCTIGNLSEVKKFRENYKRKMEKAEIRFDPPKLLSIDFYHKHFKDGTEGALNITFQLPQGKPDGYQEVEYPIAVFLHFQSVDDPKFQDSFYYKNPRERIFQFWNYKPELLYDSVNPRNISYDCLVGLDDSKPATAYAINLATAFGLNITYYCTVYAQQGREAGYTTKWLPTIATYFNLSARSVNVVFEEYTFEAAPELLVYYNVCLVLKDETIIDHKKIYQGTHSTMFTDIKHGIYYVKVSKCEENAYELMYEDNSNTQRCVSATSYVIDATGISVEQTQEYPITYTEEHDTLHLALAVGLGCLIGITAVAALILVFLKTRKKDASHTSLDDGKKSTGLILYRHTANKAVLRKFALYLQSIFHCVIYIDIPESEKESLIDAEKWCSNILAAATFVIIVCSPDSHNMSTGIHKTSSDVFYKSAIQKAISKKEKSNDIRIIPVKFSLHPNEVVPEFVSRMRCLTLMEGIDELYKSIHSYKEIPKDIQDQIKADTYFIKSKEGKDLKEALEKARQFYLDNAESKRIVLDEPLDEKENVIKAKPERNTQEIIEVQHKNESISPDVMEIFFSEVNKSDSSIDAISSVSNELDRDSDSETPENLPLLYNSHERSDKMLDNQGDLGASRTENPAGIKQSEAANLNSVKKYSETFESNDIIDKHSAHFHNSNLEYRHATDRHMIEPQLCRHHRQSSNSHIRHNQNNTPEFEQMHDISLHVSALPTTYHKFNQANFSSQQPVAAHTISSGVVPHASHVCQIHGNHNQFDSPHFESDRVYGYYYDIQPEEYSNQEQFYRPYHSFPQEHHHQYGNTHYHHVPERLQPRLEFSAVDPHDFEISERYVAASNKRRGVKIDSGYESGIPPGVANPGVANRAHNVYNADILYQRTKTTDNEQLQQSGEDDVAKYEIDDSKRHETMSSSARYSYPLSLNVKRDFNSDMFIPPDDIDPCWSDKDGSSTEIMDQLASINERTGQ